MQNIILLFALAFLVLDFSCDDSILSKFVQHGYKIKDKRTELIRYNKSIYHTFEIKTFKYNRTTTAHNCTFSGKVNLQDKTEVLIQVYKFLSNEYRHFPIRFQVNARKGFEANVMGLKTLKMCGNITTFVFQKDVIYHICNFVVDETRFPPLVPNGIYKVEVTLLYLEQEAALINLFGEIYIPIPYPKK